MADSENMIRHVVGVMTGTSIDGIDAALVRIDGRGLDMRGSVIRHVSALLGSLQNQLRAAANQQPMTAGEFARLAWEFGELHAEVIERLMANSLSLLPKGEGQGRSEGGARRSPLFVPDLICLHGQTIFHQPPLSWQLVNPAPIAARFDCPIVSDLRQADLAHGGQGAPITPIADWILFRDRQGGKRRAIVNLGGFCNITVVPSLAASGLGNPRTAGSGIGAIVGFDVCACNQLLDAIARETLGKAFDEDGVAAAHGHASPQAAGALREILERQRRAGGDRRSLGTGDEALAWLSEHRSKLAPDDLAASAVAAIAQTIIASVQEHHANELILAGGGARNRALRHALKKGSDPFSVRLSDDLGIPIDAREAACFAILGALCHDGVPITLPQVTGCRAPAPISGIWSNDGPLGPVD